MEREKTRLLDDNVFEAKLKALMVSKFFLVEVAENCAAAYDGKKEPDLFTEEEKDLLLGVKIANSEEEFVTLFKARDKYAMNLPGFYALQEGISVLHVLYKDIRQYEILTKIVNEDISLEDKEILEHLAHATWATTTPFRQREISYPMMPFNMLSRDEKDKDWVQIKSSAKTLLDHLK